MCKQIIIFFLITLVMTTTAQVLCQNGANCLSIQNCPGLNNGIKDLNLESNVITSILRRLHCGFDNNGAKFCCPALFQASGGLHLLPNTTVCGIQTSDRIYGGVLTELDEHPWTVLIRSKKSKHFSFACGGVLISSRYVLTAAHCVKKDGNTKDGQLFEVRLGEWNLASRTDCQEDDCSPDPLNVDVEIFIPHENYNQQNDIALVRLARDVPFTDFIRPICLPIDPVLRRDSFEGYDMEVAGWGQTESGTTSDVKLKTSLRVTNTEDCRVTYVIQNRTITEKQLCAGGIGGKDTCRGDSGGALMLQLGPTQNWMAVGITSFGPSPCGSTGWPGIYTRVTEYIDWIQSTMRP